MDIFKIVLVRLKLRSYYLMIVSEGVHQYRLSARRMSASKLNCQKRS